MTISDYQLNRREGQHTDIDYDIFADSALFCSRTHNQSILSAPRLFSLTRYVHEIDQGHDKHPNYVDKLPKKVAVFDVCGAVTPALVSESDDQQRDQRGEPMQEFHPGNTVIGPSKQAGAPGVFRKGHALTNHSEPLANMQDGEKPAR